MIEGFEGCDPLINVARGAEGPDPGRPCASRSDPLVLAFRPLAWHGFHRRARTRPDRIAEWINDRMVKLIILALHSDDTIDVLTQRVPPDSVRYPLEQYPIA